jgi:hypothetical protein
MDLANPSPSIGWSHSERQSRLDRGPADLVLALGLIHHLVLSNQVPLAMAARFFRELGKHLLIEFIPRSDSQAAGMLGRMPRLDQMYTLEEFERAFAGTFALVEKVSIARSERLLYLFGRREESK